MCIRLYANVILNGGEAGVRDLTIGVWGQCGGEG